MKPTSSAKQAILFTGINYLGVIIGVISTVLIYPLDKELLGIIRFIDACAQIMFPIILLGSTHALINFYPTLDAYLQKKLFSFSLLSLAKMSVIVGLAVWGCYVFVPKTNLEYFYLGFPLAIAMAYVDLFRRQAANLKRLAYVTFFEKIIPKLTLPLAFVFVLFLGWNVLQGISLYIVSYFVIVGIVGTYIYKHFSFKWHENYTDLFSGLSKKEYYWYSFFAFAGSFGQFFAFRVDSLMIPAFLGYEQNGTFSIGVTLASTLAIPATGVFALYAPVVSDLIKKSQLRELNIKYKEVARVLFFIGMLLYSLVIVGIEPFFKLLPTYDNLKESLPIIYLLGFNVVINMCTGFNNEIISYSKYYRFNLVSILILMVLNIGLNLYFLQSTDLGLVGVAIASLISMGLFNVFKTYFIYRKLKLWPFDRQYAYLLLCMISIVSIVYYIPLTGKGVVVLLIKSILIVGANLVVVLYTSWVSSLKNYLVALFTNK